MRRFSEMAEEISRPVAKPEPAEPARPSWRCCVHGCPEAGGIAENTSGPSEKWFCRWHFGEPAAQWGDITVRLRNGSIDKSPPSSMLVAKIREANAAYRQKHTGMLAALAKRVSA